MVTVWLMSVPHISLTPSVTMVSSCVFLVAPDAMGRKQWVLSHHPAHAARARANPRQRAVAPIVCDSLRRESRTLRFPGGYDRPGQHPDKGLSDRGDVGRSQAMALP